MSILKYNPQFLSPVERARLFGGREHELAELVRILRENLDRPRNQHVLVVGPRGMGKTTLLLRAVDEVAANPDLASGWLPVVAPEESYRAGSIGGFWLEMVFSLARSTADAQHDAAYHRLATEFGRALSANDDRRLATAALGYLTDVAGRAGRRLLLVVENLQMLLGEQLSPDDAWALRETMIGETRIMLMGSAVSRFREIDDASAPLFEQFLVLPLEPLDLEACRDVWLRATGEDVPRRRMRALQILTGGSPRLLVILAGFAARRSLRELTQDLAALIDEHTDYLKMTTEALPDLERRVFVTLAEIWDWAAAAAVAAQARIDLNVASAQLGRLESKRAVTSRRRGRGKQYRVAERLYSIYHLMRRRGGAAARSRAAVEFMVAYYEGPDLLGAVRAIAEEAVSLDSPERAEHLAFLATVLDSRTVELDHDAVVSRIPAALWACGDLPRELRRHAPSTAASPELPRLWPAAAERSNWPGELRRLIRRAEQAKEAGNAPGEIGALRAAGDAVARLSEKGQADLWAVIAGVSVQVAVRQWQLSRFAEARVSITNAIEFYQRLAPETLDEYLPNLALSFSLLSILLYDAGEHAGVLTAATRASETYERLVAANPDAFLPGLAKSLTLVATAQLAFGHRTEALAPMTRAAEIAERLAAQDPDACLPDLATSLKTLSTCQLAVGRRAEALASISRAVEIYQRLAAGNPESFLPGLAGSLNSLSDRQADLGQRADALASITRAVEIDERLASANPVAFLPALADSLGDLSMRQWELGQRDEALASISRAVEILQDLEGKSPAPSSKALSSTRTLRAALLIAANRAAEAAKELQELVDADPQNLRALGLLGTVHVTGGRDSLALACLSTIVGSADHREERYLPALKLAVALARRRRVEETLATLVPSALAPYLEPLIVALRREAGEDVSAPMEIEEIAEDLRRQIRGPAAGNLGA